jgi:hypothetical protein
MLFQERGLVNYLQEKVEVAMKRRFIIDNTVEILRIERFIKKEVVIHDESIGLSEFIK